MHRCPVGQSRDFWHALWQRWNAHTSGELQSVFKVQPAAIAPRVCGSEHATAQLKPAAEATTNGRHGKLAANLFMTPETVTRAPWGMQPAPGSPPRWMRSRYGSVQA
jgi:hypothetical protein